MIDIPSAQSMRHKSTAAKIARAADIIEANQEWFKAAAWHIEECAAQGYTTADIPWPADMVSYAEKKILLKQFQDAGYYVDATRESIANYCRVTW